MKSGVKVAGFLLLLAAVFALAYALGTFVPPVEL
jgi:hypothetical protein